MGAPDHKKLQTCHHHDFACSPKRQNAMHPDVFF